MKTKVKVKVRTLCGDFAACVFGLATFHLCAFRFVFAQVFLDAKNTVFPRVRHTLPKSNKSNLYIGKPSYSFKPPLTTLNILELVKFFVMADKVMMEVNELRGLQV